ncbi:alpha-L-rhamnosidase [Kineococcus rhizosphaerae]|uniref:alpha-L-rhamnosidase n=1 Tax=Kineococcus rhizosphaerae TaxID=559628 RepID=A0A2T0QXL6_9ACTN|nr:alpha-L-rhamnosidase [Kineococcus rhizosphaerae]PRY10769.1 alpha-L-rhamnosidase [Kineococcus rhizosphaerae]
MHDADVVDVEDLTDARWIAHPERPGTWPSRATCRDGRCAAPVFTHEVRIDVPVRRARLVLAAGGHADVRVDGALATDEVLSPGTTHWDRRVEVVEHDLTAVLTVGRHELSLELGRGFFGMTNANVWGWERAPWHDEPCVRAALHLEHADGSRRTVVTGPAWTVHRGPRLLDDLYAGEVVDLRFRGPRVPAALVAGPVGEPVPRLAQPSRITEVLGPVSVAEPLPGEFVVGFPRVVSGWVRLRVDGPAGTTVRLRYGERLRPDGLPNADDEKGYFTDGFQTDEITLAGGPVTWEPRFSYKGFRYVQVSGWPDPAGPGAGDVLCCVVHTDAARTCEFTVDDPLLQWIHDATVRTLENNLHGYPTDTPKYEKNGWTGDALVGADAFLTNLDAAPVLRSWVRSLAETCDPVPALTAPNAGVFGVHTRAPVWHAALLTVPWDLFRHTGDVSVLAENWAEAAAYARHELGRSPGGIADTILGDWVAPGTDPGGANPPEDSRVPATAFLVRILDVASWTAGELARSGEAAWFADRAQEVRAAFVREFLDPATGVVGGPGDAGFRQSHHVLALAFDVVSDHDVRARIAAALAADVRARDDHLDTGAIGTKWLLPVLTEAGYAELAVRIARQRTPPSWGAWFEAGATTTFEHWDLAARSHGHYFLGTVDDWLTGHVGGLRLLEPGWRSFAVDPRCTDWIDSAAVSVVTPHGTVAVAWWHEDGEVRVRVDAPPGTRAVRPGHNGA